MRHKKLILGAALLSNISFATAQDETGAYGSLDWYQSATRAVIRNFRRIIEPTLPATELEVATNIRYSATSYPGIGAFAYLSGGRRRVDIHAGIVQISEFLSVAYIVEADLGYAGCFDEYSKYAGEIVISNTERVRAGLSAERVYNPVAYAVEIGGACDGFEPHEFGLEQGRFRAGLLDASIGFLYLHELAHHVLGHVDGPKIESLSELRAQEDEADRWAIATSFRAGYNLGAAIPVMQLIALTGGNSLESETKSTHPLGVRRFLNLFIAVRDQLQSQEQTFSNEADYKQVINSIDTSIDALESAIERLP